MHGLFKAVEQALAAAGIAADALQEAWLDITDEPAMDLEWFQVTRRLWRPRIPKATAEAEDLELNEQFGFGRTMPEIHRSHRSLGAAGAASLPLHMVMATESINAAARMSRFGFSPPGSMLVCETSNPGNRGAVCLGPADYQEHKQSEGKH